MSWLNNIIAWFTNIPPASQAVVIAALIAAFVPFFALLWNITLHFLPKSSETPAPNQSILSSPPTVTNGGVAFNSTAPVTINMLDPKLLEIIQKELHKKDLTIKEKDDYIKNFEKALQALPSQISIPDAATKISEAFEQIKQGNTSYAESIFREVEERKKLEGKAAHKEAAQAAIYQGSLAYLHDTDKAIEAYTRATQLDPESPEAWNLLGIALFTQKSHFNEALSAFQKLENIAQKLPEKTWLAAVYGNQSNIYADIGEPKKAIELQEKSLALNIELKDLDGEADNYGSLGNIYISKGNTEKAQEMYEKSLALNEKLERKFAIAKNYNNLGQINLEKGNLDKAKEFFEKSISINKELGIKDSLADAYSSMGNLYLKLGKNLDAITFHEKSLEIEIEIGRKAGEADSYGALGIAYKNLNQLDQALEMFEKSFEINKALNRKDRLKIDNYYIEEILRLKKKD